MTGLAILVGFLLFLTVGFVWMAYEIDHLHQEITTQADEDVRLRVAADKDRDLIIALLRAKGGPVS